MIKTKFLVTSTVEAVNGRTFEKDKAYWLRPDQYAFWDARGRIGPAPDDMPAENAPFSIVRAGRDTFDVAGPSNRRLNAAALPWADAEALRASAEADWLARGRPATIAAAVDVLPTPDPPPAIPEPAIAPPVQDEPAGDIRNATASAGNESDGAAELFVAKGPGGRWFVKRGDVNVSRGFATEDEAKAAMAEMSTGGTE